MKLVSSSTAARKTDAGRRRRNAARAAAAAKATDSDESGARRRLTPEDRRRQILDAAIQYFAEVGFDGGTRDLARRLGVTQPLIYRYFPSKEDLIRQVYEEVYLGRWRAEWEVMITDRSIPLRDRLVAFYRSYGEVIFATEWMRIYLFAGLRGLGINRWWITFVESHVLQRICEELRIASKLPPAEEIAIDDAEIDFLWILHGGIFYNGGLPTAKPGDKLRLSTITVRAWSTSMVGMPAMGLPLGSRAIGFTMSFAPMTMTTSVSLNSGLMSSISLTWS